VPVQLPTPDDGAHRLARLDLLSTLPPDALEALAAEVEWLRLHAGEVVFREGDVADSACFVLRGRLRASVTGDDGSRVIGEVAPGQPVGELGLLAGVPRTATVRAVRDTDLVRLTQSTLDRLLRAAPDAIGGLVRVVATRAALSGRSAGGAAGPTSSTVAIVTTHSGIDRDGFARQLILALEAHGDTLHWRGSGDVEASASALTATLDAHDRIPGLAVLEVDAQDAERATGVLRQADRILVVADATQPPGLDRVADLLTRVEEYGCDPTVELVLLQPHHRQLPSGTRQHLGGWPFDAHHHIRAGSDADFARLGRHLLGASIGLVLGGGGGRGMAHIGVWRAMTEAGLPVDRISGASVGAVLSAQIAAGWSAERMQVANRAEWAAKGVVKRPAVPLFSLMSAAAGVAMVEGFFGDADLEDLWIPCQVATVDLTRCRLAMQDRGPAARWTLASATPPGIWPPVVDDDGALFVDGAVIDNLPVVPIRDAGAGRVIAVNVSKQTDFSAPPGVHDVPRLRDVMRGLTERPRSPSFPSVIQTLNRTALVTGLAGYERARELSDLFLSPPVDHISLSDYGAIDEAAELGYTYAREVFADNADLLASWT
jgi:predicted acylesterase/phospholipase RssA/CRP-like cAMP-binding protein